MDSMTYSDFNEHYPDLFQARCNNKYFWCFPNGESYELAMERVKPVLKFISENNVNCAIVGHQGINRIIIGYFLDLPETEIPYLSIPNDVIYIIHPETKTVSRVPLKGGKNEKSGT